MAETVALTMGELDRLQVMSQLAERLAVDEHPRRAEHAPVDRFLRAGFCQRLDLGIGHRLREGRAVAAGALADPADGFGVAPVIAE